MNVTDCIVHEGIISCLVIEFSTAHTVVKLYHNSCMIKVNSHDIGLLKFTINLK